MSNSFCSVPEALLVWRAQTAAQGSTLEAQELALFRNAIPAHIVILSAAHIIIRTLEIEAVANRVCGTWSLIVVHSALINILPRSSAEDNIDGVHAVSTTTMSLRRNRLMFGDFWQVSCS